MAADASHSFRYEDKLCTLAEGETLSQWRRRRKDERTRADRKRRRRRLLKRGGRSSGFASPR